MTFDDYPKNMDVDSVLAVELSTIQVLSHLQDIYDAYLASYNDAASTTDRMERAKGLAFALLTHYYPATEGYIVQPSTLGPVAKHGINFMLKADDGSNPEYTPLPPPSPPRLPKNDPKKGKMKKPTRTQLERERKAAEKAAYEAAYISEFNHWFPFATSIKWHRIKAEDIAGFVVMKMANTIADEGTSAIKTECRPHTYLAILIDDLATFTQIAETNDMHRGDILVDALSRTAKVQTGYGMLLYGTRIEFYDFDNGKETKTMKKVVVDETTGEETVKVELADIAEPFITMSEATDEGDLVVDMRSMGLEAVDQAFRKILSEDVIYISNVVETGEEQTDGSVGDGLVKVEPEAKIKPENIREGLQEDLSRCGDVS